MTFALQPSYVCLRIKKSQVFCSSSNYRDYWRPKGNVQWLFNVLKWEGGIHELKSKPLRLGFEGPPCRQSRRLRGRWFRKTEDTPGILHWNSSQWGWEGEDVHCGQWDNTKMIPAGSSASITTTQGRKQRKEAEALEPKSQVYWQKLEPWGTCDQGGRHGVMEEQQQPRWPLLPHVLQSPSGAPYWLSPPRSHVVPQPESCSFDALQSEKGRSESK